MKRINFSSTRNNKSNTPYKLEFLFISLIIITTLIKSIYFQFTTGLNMKPYDSRLNTMMLLASLSILIILYSLTFLFFKRYRCLFIFILNIVITGILYSDTIYFRYYGNALTVPVLFQIGLIGPLGGSIKSLVKLSDLIYVVDIPLFIAGLVLFFRRGFNSISLKKRLIGAFAGIIIGLASFIIIYSNINTLWFPYDKNYVSKELGIMYFHLYDVETYLANNVFVDKSLSSNEKSMVTAYFNDRKEKNTGNSFKGIARGKNLIIVQLEAFQQFVINRSINGKEITPNLNRLLKESLYFDNFYYQVGEGNTADAEFLSNNSLYPANEGAAYFRYPTNTYHALPGLLKKQGYGTFAFHAYTASFWNRDVIYKTIGFDRFFSQKDFKATPKIGFGLNDKDFLTQSLDKIKRDKPFYGFMITLSSHFAYAPFEYYEFETGKYEHTEMGNYLKAANYVDESLGNFIEEIKKRGLYDNTVLVMYGDHFMMPKNKASQLLEFLGLDNSDLTWTRNEKVPLIIHYPGLKNGITDNTIGGEIDILPTVANLLGLDTPLAIGKDLLNTGKGYAVLRNGSVITNKFIYVSEKKAAFDPVSGGILTKSKYEKALKDYQNQLKISDLILKKNAFKVIK